VFHGRRVIGKPFKRLRDRDRELQLFPFNEEFLVSASHQLALIMSLLFVHTARRYPGLNRFEKYRELYAGLVLRAVNWLDRDGLNRVKVVTRYR
jgi:hypothetical protein